MQLLVVEDDSVVGRALRQGLSEANVECQWVRDGEQGLELAKSQQFGIRFARHFAARSRRTRGLERASERAGILTPVLLLTASGTVEDGIAGLTAGADDYLVKPLRSQS